MRLKAPPETTHVQSPTAVYAIDDEGAVMVPDGHPDEAMFLALGFTPCGDAPAAIFQTTIVPEERDETLGENHV